MDSRKVNFFNEIFRALIKITSSTIKYTLQKLISRQWKRLNYVNFLKCQLFSPRKIQSAIPIWGKETLKLLSILNSLEMERIIMKKIMK